MKIEDNTLIKVTNEDIIDGTFIVPNGINGIGHWLFDGCISLNNIVLPDGLEWIGRGAFNCCTSIQSIVLPETLREIGDLAFQNCTSLNHIVIPKSVEKIGDDVFYECNSIIIIECANEDLREKIKYQSILGRELKEELINKWGKLIDEN